MAALVVGVCLTAFGGLFGWTQVSSARQTANVPPPPGGFAPLAGARGRATAYWERNGQPLDMKNPWHKPGADGFHDPDSDAVKRLQSPREAMKDLPRSGTGNFVNWVTALKNGDIDPRAEVDRAGEMERRDNVVVMRNTKSMPTVSFSHAKHTEWLACSNCHDSLFPKKAGATPIKMKEIFQGKHCGVCHGKVAFPPDMCFRCHDGPRRQAQN